MNIGQSMPMESWEHAAQVAPAGEQWEICKTAFSRNALDNMIRLWNEANITIEHQTDYGPCRVRLTMEWDELRKTGPHESEGTIIVKTETVDD